MQHPDPLGTPTTVLPDTLLPGTWSEPAAPPVQDPWAGTPRQEPRGRHGAPLTGPGAVPLSFTDQLLEPVVGWWRGLRRAAAARDRRLLIAAVVLLPTLAVFGVVALLPGPPPAPTAAVTPSPDGSAAPSADPAAAAPVVGELTALTADRAAALMQDAGLSMPGAPSQAWTFRDRGGLNLLVATAEPTGPQDVTLRVALFGSVDGTATSRSRLADAGLPGCTPQGNPDNGKRNNEKRRKRDRSGPGNGNQDQGRNQQDQQPAPSPEPEPVAAAGFTIDSVTLADHDRDGTGEVTIGWSSSCGAPGSVPSRAQLATIAGSRTFLLQGTGMLGGSGDAPAAEPAAASWPAGSYEAATALFHRLYF